LEGITNAQRYFNCHYRPTLLGSVSINLQELEGSVGNSSIVLLDKWFSLKGDSKEEEEDSELIVVPLSSSPPTSTPNSVVSPSGSLPSERESVSSSGSIPNSPQPNNTSVHLNLKQELEILQERLEYAK
jgi:hypothetical protein